MVKVKELYKYQSFTELKKHYELPCLNGKKFEKLVQYAQKLLREAEKYENEGDEELAYVQYMKFCNIMEHLRKMPEIKQIKKRPEFMMKEYFVRFMDKLEKIHKSLEYRYEERNSFLTRETNNINSVHSENSENALNNFTNNSVITPDELNRFIQNGSVLIMDCRQQFDYESSHLLYDWCFNVPEHIIKNGLSAGKIQEQLDINSKKLWAARLVKELIVLMDLRSKQAVEGTTIWQLQQIFQNWDPDVNYDAIKILEGGYEDFSIKYPMKCTNAAFITNQLWNQPKVDHDEVEYPTIDEITMKEDVIIDSFSSQHLSKISPPEIDRSSKPAAESLYNKNLIIMYTEKKNLADKALTTKKELLEAEQEWKKIQIQKENRLPKIQEKELLSREYELHYNIIQLESKGDDIELERDQINQDLKEFQKGKEFSQVDEELVAKTTQNYESLCEKEKQINEKLIKEKREREKLQSIREQKRHIGSSSEEDDEISKPKIPQFDRSIKPIRKQAFPPIIERIMPRDFSPVRGNVTRGLTGLKNLGNTCYMNSILQCLSNTNSLTDYLITNKYKQDINRTNKTKGQIVEEVAALIRVLWKGQYKCVASKELRHVIGQYQQIFRGIEQQDSHEFLTILMDWLHSDLQTLENPKIPCDSYPPSQKAWLEFTKSHESLILQLFYGQIKSTVKCVHCNKESATYECFSNLSLELPSNTNQCGLINCMEMYFAGERIQGWICPDCKQSRQAIKKLNISRLPPILVIHLKRFYADSDFIGHSYKKKQSYVRFPLENLNMSQFVTKSELRSGSSKIYNLYGVSNHYGTMESGHYTAFCKSSVNGKWIKFDDQMVTEFDRSNVESSAAYILFYTSLPLKIPAEVI